MHWKAKQKKIRDTQYLISNTKMLIVDLLEKPVFMFDEGYADSIVIDTKEVERQKSRLKMLNKRLESDEAIEVTKNGRNF